MTAPGRLGQRCHGLSKIHGCAHDRAHYPRAVVALGQLMTAPGRLGLRCHELSKSMTVLVKLLTQEQLKQQELPSPSACFYHDAHPPVPACLKSNMDLPLAQQPFESATSPEHGMFQYFLKVVPTKYTSLRDRDVIPTNQYS
eukprot:scaffold133942_cov20-Tisochrysis_lutea.AAC.1